MIMKPNTNKENKTLKFLKELLWLLDTYKDISLQDVIDLAERRSSCQSESYHLQDDGQYLVGVLPQIFQDEELFPKKEDILTFADEVLGIKLNIMAKRSRIEYIGTILCQVSNYNGDYKKLVEILETILSNESKMKEFKKRKKEEPNFSWNDTIFKMDI